ncbi:aldo/keto reductase [uncultured Schumannella sp.]|uniref:aldo/keto reductase n=1 Tax=uncultured Schumannella sp. TaxID=1195956 RepID=UPI0025E5EAE0|nr:aldo/keto reductase [uncultured Schumannella sp.]
MESRRLGTRGPLVSTIGLGCNNLGRAGTRTATLDGVRAVIDAAIGAGVTLFDTADIYGAEFGLSETLLGQALAGREGELVIASKFGHAQFAPALAGDSAPGSRSYLRAAVEGSLTRLGIERIDLYQQHTPDPSTPIEETIAALDELVTEGKIAAFGHSNFDATQIRAAADAATRLGVAPFVSAQNEYNLLAREVEREVLPASEDVGIGFLPFFPLANGLFTGKFTRTERPADTRISRQRPHIADEAPWDAIEAFERFAAEREISLLEATFGWFLGRGVVSSVIAGATSPEQIRTNAAAGSGWRASEAELAEIGALFPLGDAAARGE